MTKQLLFILDWYPTTTNNGCVFAKHLICAIADKGYECIVIAPRPVTPQMLSKTNRVKMERVEQTENGSSIRIYMPFYFHLSSRKQTMRYSMQHHFSAVMKVIKKYKLHPDLVYGHFLYQCGLTAARVGAALGIPSWCACGENSLRLQKGSLPYETGLRYCGWREIADRLTGVISVSSNNRDLLYQNGFISQGKKLGIFPNGVNSNLFYKMDKADCRRRLGFSENEFIVIFTGALSVNKGADKLNEALKVCTGIRSVFLGKGPVMPDCDGLLFCGTVPNADVPLYLNSADVFVLPTKGEGCSNAIVEALACGLPVISSDLPFNDDILNEGNSIRIDVNDTHAIAAALQKLKNDAKLRKSLSENAAETGKKLDIRLRADRILRFMELEA